MFNMTVPEPLPEVAPNTVIHEGKPETDQEQLLAAVIVIVHVPPAAGNSTELGLSV